MKGHRFDKLCEDKKDLILNFLGCDDHFKYNPFQFMTKLSKDDPHNVMVKSGVSLMHIDEMLKDFDDAYTVRLRRFIGIQESEPD